MTSPPHETDLQQLSDLLLGASGRYRSARAVIRLSVDGAVARESNRRFVDWSFDESVGMEVIGKPGPPVREDFYREYEDAEDLVLLWHERPDRWRQEWRDGDTGGLLEAVAFGGRGSSLWVYQPPELAIHVPRIPEERDPDPSLAFMLDPSEEMFHLSLFDGATVRKTGRTAVVAGRKVFEVRAETISWGYPPTVFRGQRVPEGTTDHILHVDAEVGTVLRAAARLDGREFHVAEVEEIYYDEGCPKGTFRLELPDVEFKRLDR